MSMRFTHGDFAQFLKKVPTFETFDAETQHHQYYQSSPELPYEI